MMEPLHSGYYQGTSIEHLTRTQVEAAIRYLDHHRAAATDNNQVIQDCVLKVDLINRLMALEKRDRQSFRG